MGRKEVQTESDSRSYLFVFGEAQLLVSPISVPARCPVSLYISDKLHEHEGTGEEGRASPGQQRIKGKRRKKKKNRDCCISQR
mmetsp:Transcript_36983/g.72736  ORF Transcript_36983/g.72736 Transcript_36983/m.72736 type:complete len:83 (+) Transcript_36983:1095-1343(+)